MASLVQSRSAQTSAASPSLALAFSGNVTAANTIVVGGGSWQMPFGAQSASTTGIASDTRTNAYSRAGNESASTNAHAAIYYADNISGGACTVTLDPTGSNNDITILLSEWSGMANPSFDVAKPASGDATSVGTGTGASSTFTSATTATTAQAAETVIAVFAHDGTTSTPTAGAGYTLPAGLIQSSASHMPAALEYKAVAATGTQQATIGWVTGALFGSVVATFKDSGGAAAAAARRLPLLGVG